MLTSEQTETFGLFRFFGFLPSWCFGQITIFDRNTLFRMILAAHFSIIQ